ncbi:MAG TPA: MarP family serine protease [Acidimicrobiales bacterium]|nr:MarP family serine protease [Acidimicrobiales bacterium]
MNVVDLIVILLMVGAAVGGYRLGFLARALSWAGMGLGLVLAARFLPSVLERFESGQPSGKLMIAVGVLLGGTFIGQALGLVVGARVQGVLPPGGRPLDRVAGAVSGVLGILVGVWLMLPTLGAVPGTMARLARSSTVLSTIDDVAPPPPDTLQALRRLVGDTSFPEVFSGLDPSPDVGPPPAESGLSQETLDRVIPSTVQIEGPACGRIQEGSGFVAAEGIVVTNAHVVAGESETEVLTQDGRRVPARVVHFDPDRDLAVLAAPDLGLAPLPIGDAGPDDVGAVLGHPGGGPLEVSPYLVSDEVEAVGRDLYDRRETRRQVLVLAADLAPGDSGAALVDPDGEVVGVAFAIAPDRPGTAYALDVVELQAALAAPRGDEVDTGRCL